MPAPTAITRAPKTRTDKIETQPVQGCRDFPPDEMRQRNYLFNAFRKTAEGFGFEEFDAPMLEPAQLYQRKSGDEITQQMYHFQTADDHHVALRPELTPSLARLVLSKGKALLFPAKWYTIGQCWRYETITRGRRREHYQWNMDILGVKTVAAEAELICAAISTLEALGITSRHVVVRIGSRKLLKVLMEEVGVTEDGFPHVCNVIDKRGKLSPEELHGQLQHVLNEHELSDCDPQAILDVTEISSLEKVAAFLKNDDHPAVCELLKLFELVNASGFGSWISFDASIVRGLAYYTGIVFEAFDRRGELRAIFGGGRYDELLSIFGISESIPCCGFGFGDCVIVELLKLLKLKPELVHHIDDIVICDTTERQNLAMEVAAKLRSRGRRVVMTLDVRKLRQAMAYADRIGALRSILVLNQHKDNVQPLVVKNMRSGFVRDGSAVHFGDQVTLDELLNAIPSPP